MKYQTGSIRQVRQQLCGDGYCVTENTLRSWIKQGILPAAYSGKKAYISCENVIRILKDGTPMPSVETGNNGIRKINV